MVIVSLGANANSPQGAPLQTLIWALKRLGDFRMQVVAVSPFYSTEPVGQPGQQDYVNGVVRIETALSALNLLKALKRIEREAGRDLHPLRVEGRWGERPLDLDLVDYKGRVSRNYRRCSVAGQTGSGRRRRPCKLVFPHPEAHLRPFVIRPVLDVAPFWHHPVSGLPVRSLWARLGRHGAGSIRHEIM